MASSPDGSGDSLEAVVVSVGAILSAGSVLSAELSLSVGFVGASDLGVLDGPAQALRQHSANALSSKNDTIFFMT